MTSWRVRIGRVHEVQAAAVLCSPPPFFQHQPVDLDGFHHGGLGLALWGTANAGMLLWVGLISVGTAGAGWAACGRLAKLKLPAHLGCAGREPAGYPYNNMTDRFLAAVPTA